MEDTLSRNKSRILMLYRILEKYTDEDHQLSMEEILQKLYDKGFECDSLACHHEYSSRAGGRNKRKGNKGLGQELCRAGSNSCTA